PAPCDQGENVTVDPGRRCALAALREQAQPACQPARLTTLVAVGVALDAPAADRDLTHAELLLLDPQQDSLADAPVEHDRALEDALELRSQNRRGDSVPPPLRLQRAGSE